MKIKEQLYTIKQYNKIVWNFSDFPDTRLFFNYIEILFPFDYWLVNQTTRWNKGQPNIIETELASRKCKYMFRFSRIQCLFKWQLIHFQAMQLCQK